MKTIDIKASLDTLAKLERIKNELSNTLAALDATPTASVASTLTFNTIQLGTQCGSSVAGFSNETRNYVEDDYRAFLMNMISRIKVEIASLEVGS